MAHHYFDTSAIVKLYVPENGSRWVDHIFSRRTPQGLTVHTIAFAKIGIVETAAALARYCRMGIVSQEKQTELYSLFIKHARERFATLAVGDDDVYHAAQLTQRHSLRGYDAVHLASALAFNRSLLAARLAPAIFVSADDTLCLAARAEGLQIENPNTKQDFPDD